MLSNGSINGCGNGGIEFKTGRDVTDSDEVYSDVLLSNVSIRMNSARHAIVFNWTSARTNSRKRGERVTVANCMIRHELEPADQHNTDAVGIEITAWSEIFVLNNHISGSTIGIKFAPEGASNDHAEALTIQGNRIEGVLIGFEAQKNSLAAIEIAGNSVICARLGIAFRGARVTGASLYNNRIEQQGAHEGSAACILLSNCRDIMLWNNMLISEHGYGVHIHKRTVSSEGSVLRNVIRSRKAAVRIDEGRWTVADNFCRTGAAEGAVMRTGKADVQAAWNVRDVRFAPGRSEMGAGEVVLAGGGGAEGLGWAATDTGAPGRFGIPHSVSGRGAPEQAGALPPHGWTELLHIFGKLVRRAVGRR